MLRDTKARWRNRVPFLGVEGGVYPLIISGAVSIFLILGATFMHPDWQGFGIALVPFAVTWSYMRLFLTGKRPHYARDFAAGLRPHSRYLSPAPPRIQPVHPYKKRSKRAVRNN